jgi:hypothetical protein
MVNFSEPRMGESKLKISTNREEFCKIVGNSDGINEGLKVGVSDGVMEGITVGDAVGVREGKREGKLS